LGVTSFRGRTGAVVPQSGDYTAEMVGAIPSTNISAAVITTQAEYDAMAEHVGTVLYMVFENKE